MSGFKVLHFFGNPERFLHVVLKFCVVFVLIPCWFRVGFV